MATLSGLGESIAYVALENHRLFVTEQDACSPSFVPLSDPYQTQDDHFL
jgi:hypothetical protein